MFFKGQYHSLHNNTDIMLFETIVGLLDLRISLAAKLFEPNYVLTFVKRYAPRIANRKTGLQTAISGEM